MSDEPAVVEVDFGKEQREAARIFAKLMGMVEQQEADIIANPIKYWRLAGDKIVRLQRVIEGARDALRRPVDFDPSDEARARYVPLETMNVERGEWDRHRTAAAIIWRGEQD